MNISPGHRGSGVTPLQFATTSGIKTRTRVNVPWMISNNKLNSRGHVMQGTDRGWTQYQRAAQTSGRHGGGGAGHTLQLRQAWLLISSHWSPSPADKSSFIKDTGEA